jgi:ceramide glucosyltransferase
MELVAYLILAVLAVVQSLLLALQTWEHRRYARSNMRQLDRHHPTAHVAVFAPCKGIDLDLEANLRALFQQDHPNFELVFVVESREDPAGEVIHRLMAKYPTVAARLVIAGRTSESGQKVHNLRAATAELSPEIDCLAFVDSDAQPRREWLRALVARLDRPDLAVTTGYRWFVPARPTLANHLLYSINCGVMFLLGRHSHCLVWGGSWALRRDTFDSLRLREAWRGTLSDDLVASRLLRKAGMVTRFEPVAVVNSPLDLSGRQMFAFLRRQYLIARCYVPLWWALGLCVSTLANLLWLVSAAMLVRGMIDGSVPVWLPLGVCATVYLLSVQRGAVRQSLARTYFPQHYAALRPARRFDIWASPLVNFVNWLGMFGAMFGRHIHWRGLSYQMLPGGQIRSMQPAAAVERKQRAQESGFMVQEISASTCIEP